LMKSFFFLNKMEWLKVTYQRPVKKQLFPVG
jgi:hypothetical protein